MSDFAWEQTGKLPRSGGHVVAWDARGAAGAPWVVALHGGPGSGRSRRALDWFPSKAWRLVRFDQRGCGESRPHAGEPDPRPAFFGNTTHELIADIEALRSHLGVERWAVFGSSWGATLGLAYAQAHPERVTALAVAALTTTSSDEVEWITEGVRAFAPEAWARFAAAASHAPGARLVDAYDALLSDPRPEIHAPAAAAWAAWEQALAAIQDPGGAPHPRWSDPRFRLAFARLTARYWSRGAFIRPNQLLQEAHRLRGIPGRIVHGRYDLAGPPQTAWRISQAWADATLEIVDGGHDVSADDTAETRLRSAIETLRVDLR